MTAEDVLEVLGLLDAAGLEWWLEGGWGVDALLGAETRPHRDLDLGVRLEDLGRVERALVGFGRVETAEWPGFVVLQDERQRRVDLMLVDREGWQRLANSDRIEHSDEHTNALGQINERVVRCASVQVQLAHARPCDVDALSEYFHIRDAPLS